MIEEQRRDPVEQDEGNQGQTEVEMGSSEELDREVVALALPAFLRCRRFGGMRCPDRRLRRGGCGS